MSNETIPTAPSYDAIHAAARALHDAMDSSGPLLRGVPIMGFELRPSPELHGGGRAVLTVDYEDGKTRVFDIDAFARSTGAVVRPRAHRIDQVIAFEVRGAANETEAGVRFHLAREEIERAAEGILAARGIVCLDVETRHA